MARYERGVYEPDDEIRVFDGSEDDEDAEGSRLPLLIVLALLVLVMFAGVVWLAYTQGVARGRGEPSLLAQTGPAKAGNALQTPAFKIYEQPAPPDEGANSSLPEQQASTAPPAAAAPPLAVPHVPKVAPAPESSPTAALPPVVPAKPGSVASAGARPVGPATAPPKQLGAAAAAIPTRPVEAPAVSAPVPAATGGAFVLQLGAYKSQDDATQAWRAYQARHATLLAGYSQDIQRADLGDKGVWYRLRISGFSSADVATAMCDRLKADGGGCFLSK